MACHAILTNQVGVLTGKLCRNYSMNGCLYCHQHQNISQEEHKSRWLRKFILGADGKPFLYLYEEYKKTRILGDLRDGIITLTDEDIQKIPDRPKYLDIYLLLFENDYITLSKNNVNLYGRALLYLSEFWYRTDTSEFLPLSPLGKKILDILVLRDAEHLCFFLYMLVGIFQSSRFRGDQMSERIGAITAFLHTLLDSPAAKQMCWDPSTRNFLERYEEKLGEQNPITVFMREIYLPAFMIVYRFEKAYQKSRTNQFKEELMAVTWHPDRFMDYCLDEEEKAENRILFG